MRRISTPTCQTIMTPAKTKRNTNRDSTLTKSRTSLCISITRGATTHMGILLGKNLINSVNPAQFASATSSTVKQSKPCTVRINSIRNALTVGQNSRVRAQCAEKICVVDCYTQSVCLLVQKIQQQQLFYSSRGRMADSRLISFQLSTTSSWFCCRSKRTRFELSLVAGDFRSVGIRVSRYEDSLPVVKQASV